MLLSLIKDIARPHVIDLIMLLKRSRGMSVNELSAAMRMSYMGVKQHCIYLEKKGYLGTWLRPKPAGGRPEKMYRLTPKMNQLFPSAVGEALLDMIEVAEAEMGEAAVKALLAGVFERKGIRYASLLKGRSLVERAQSLAKLRTSDGCLSMCEFDAHDGLRLVEHHSPLEAVGARHPLALELETRMLGSVLRCLVERVDKGEKDVPRVEYRLKNFPE